jgi:hypothetical protein
MRIKDEVTKAEIQEIIGGLECPEDFVCYKSGFETLCRASDIKMELFVECLEEEARSCQFSVPFGEGHFCKCPLRVYICKKLRK